MEEYYLSQAKIFNHLDRVQEWLKTGICFPITIEIDPTNKCTRNCAECAGNRYDTEAQLSLDFMKDIINQIAPFCRGLIFTGGGESLCNNATIPAIEYAKQKEIDVVLVTNGDLVDETKSDKLVRLCTYIRISYNDENVWRGLALLVGAKKAADSRCTIGVGLLTNKERQRLMEDFAAKAKKTGVDYAQFRPFHLDAFDAREKIKILQEKFDDDSFNIVSSDYKYVGMVERTKKTKSYPLSFVDNFRTVIAANGKIYPDCWTRGMDEFSLGNLHDANFSQIWKSERKKEILNSKLDKAECPPMCYHDPLNELLWNIWQQNKYGEHVNFV